MQNYIKKLLLGALVIMTLGTLASAQTFPAQATGIFTLDIGNELRVLQTLPSAEIQGILASPKKEKLADFKGNYDKNTGKFEGELTYCQGKKEPLLFYFTRNNADVLEVYFGLEGNDRKAAGTRKGRTRPSLAFNCAAGSDQSQSNEPYMGKGTWTGTWKTNLGMIRLIQINDVKTGKTFVSGDFENTGVIHLIGFSGNEVEGEFMSSTKGDGYFKITRISDDKFEGTYRWGRQTEWTPWGGERKDTKLPQLTSTGAQHFINRLLAGD
ncbi:hypothetical protein J2X69_001302 [Algoriphagus sp. 4150]|uniref:hypothetical protein n=1 Tax=Algoriphagus sp. 4150 TaxID=2817756 RepID=UPI00285631BD|nr:hypothetical protein [Algoriphagus sp. 4150]MDR7128967.1 hypothetical protein [Algoriphagus sp. 4150]